MLLLRSRGQLSALTARTIRIPAPESQHEDRTPHHVRLCLAQKQRRLEMERIVIAVQAGSQRNSPGRRSRSRETTERSGVQARSSSMQRSRRSRLAVA